MPLMSPTLPRDQNEPRVEISPAPKIEPQQKETPPEPTFQAKSEPVEVKTISKVEILPNPNALDVLKAAGVNSRRGTSRMSPLLSNEGLGLEECARKLTTFASYSEDESIQFQATKLALQLHGELDKDTDKSNSVQINFVGVTPDLLSVLIPRS